MANELSINVRGIAETQRTLEKFSKALSNRVIRLALRSGANYMRDQIRAAAPVKTGRLRRSIVVRSSKINTLRKNGKIGVFVGIKKGGKRKDKSGAYYGPFVEYGHQPSDFRLTKTSRRRAGIVTNQQANALRRAVKSKTKSYKNKRVNGQFFVKKTFNSTNKKALDLIVKNIEEGGRQLVAKLR